MGGRTERGKEEAKQSIGREYERPRSADRERGEDYTGLYEHVRATPLIYRVNTPSSGNYYSYSAMHDNYSTMHDVTHPPMESPRLPIDRGHRSELVIPPPPPGLTGRWVVCGCAGAATRRGGPSGWVCPFYSSLLLQQSCRSPVARRAQAEACKPHAVNRTPLGLHRLRRARTAICAVLPEPCFLCLSLTLSR